MLKLHLIIAGLAVMAAGLVGAGRGQTAPALLDPAPERSNTSVAGAASGAGAPMGADEIRSDLLSKPLWKVETGGSYSNAQELRILGSAVLVRRDNRTLVLLEGSSG